MIVENDCLILHIFEMSDGETREEVLMDVINHRAALPHLQPTEPMLCLCRNW